MTAFWNGVQQSIFANGPMGVVGNRNSVEIVIAKGCWVQNFSFNTFACENVINGNGILFCRYNRILEKG